MRVLLAFILALGFTFAISPTGAQACGPDTNCDIDDHRHYRIRMPEGHDGETPVGAIFYAHGYKGSAKGAMRNQSMAKAVSDLGLALVALKSFGDDWFIANAPNEPKPEELVEMVYVDAVIADVTTRFAVDPSKLMLTGFSAGGMMTWTVACENGEKFAGYAPMAGTFWEPTPTFCPSPATHVLHTHGTSDRVVPLTGRPILNTHQGNISNVMSMYANQGNFGEAKTYKVLDLECSRSTNRQDKVLEICLHPGGHEFKTQYIVRAWQELEKLGAVN